MDVWFNLADAAKELSLRTGHIVSERAVARLAEDGTLPVCFEYRGNIGVFALPGDQPFYAATRIVWFEGYLQSVPIPSVQSRGHFPILNVERGYLDYIAAQTGTSRLPDSSDLLFPMAVRIRRKIHADPDVETLTLVGPHFIARTKAWEAGIEAWEAGIALGVCHEQVYVSHAPVPATEWLFHSDDLAALIADQKTSTDTPPAANEGRAAQETESSVETGKDATPATIAKLHAKLKRARVHAYTKRTAEEFGCTERWVTECVNNEKSKPPSGMVDMTKQLSSQAKKPTRK